MFTGAAFLLLATAPASPGQENPDSLAMRLRRAENAIEVLQQQLAEQSERGASARSGMRLEWYGRVMVNTFSNSRRVNNVDNPQVVRPDTTPGVPARGLGMAIRQTTLGLAVTAPDVLGGNFIGDVDVDFYGGQMPSGGGRTFPLLRLRTARAQVRWSHAHLLIGQEMPLISGLNPETPAGIGSPDFSGAGNLWLWLPQVRAGVETSGRMRFGAQAAILAPTSGDASDVFNTDNDVAERSQRPFLESRAYVRWEDESRLLASEVGCGVHQGWIVPATELEDSFAVACDVMLPLREWFELRGEFFHGQALKGLGGGAIAQNVNAFGDPLQTTGGWAQVNLRPTFTTRLGFGCGADHPAGNAARIRNDQCATYAELRPSGPLFFGAEWRRMRTGYANANYTNDYVTFVAGFEF